jgi:RimJ/RimL family protein N-acetyltransferase
MYLKQGDLVIRKANEDDAAILCNWWNDGKVMDHAGFPNGLGTTVEKVLHQINKSTAQNQLLMIEYYQKPIGEMNYRTIGEVIVEIGIKICESTEQEKGFGTILLKMLINYLFYNHQVHKIKLDTNLLNTRAQHVYEKIGFKKIRTNYDAWKNQLGILQSSIDYELTLEDYQLNNKNLCTE